MLQRTVNLRTLYVHRPLLSNSEVTAWAKAQGFVTTLADDMHVTVAFSREPVDWTQVSPSDDQVVVPSGGDRSVEKLGEATVLRFNSDRLRTDWQRFIDSGASWDWPSYKPHVTISYGDVDLDKVKPFEGELVFGPEIFAEVDEDWNNKIEESIYIPPCGRHWQEILDAALEEWKDKRANERITRVSPSSSSGFDNMFAGDWDSRTAEQHLRELVFSEPDGTQAQLIDLTFQALTEGLTEVQSRSILWCLQKAQQAAGNSKDIPQYLDFAFYEETRAAAFLASVMRDQNEELVEESIRAEIAAWRSAQQLLALFWVIRQRLGDDPDIEDLRTLLNIGQKVSVPWVTRYSDDQPRDEDGKWTSGGGGDGDSGGGGGGGRANVDNAPPVPPKSKTPLSNALEKWHENTEFKPDYGARGWLFPNGHAMEFDATGDINHPDMVEQATGHSLEEVMGEGTGRLYAFPPPNRSELSFDAVKTPTIAQIRTVNRLVAKYRIKNLYLDREGGGWEGGPASGSKSVRSDKPLTSDQVNRLFGDVWPEVRGKSKDFDEAQHPRDEHGRWVGSGDGGDDRPAGYSKDSYVDQDGVIHTSNVEDAARALFEDRKVELKQPREVATLIEHLGQVTKHMIAMGGSAPRFNLCNVSVSGTNLFCANTKGIPRVEMPQLDSQQTKDFRKYLSDKGYAVEKGKELASHLRATQNELDGAKTAKIAEKMRDDPSIRMRRMVVSRDNYILDGHHHWAARIGIDAADNKLGDEKIRIARVDIGIIDLLKEAEAFTGGKGHKKAFDESEHPRDEHGKWVDSGGDDEPELPLGGGGNAVEEFVDNAKSEMNDADRDYVKESVLEGFPGADIGSNVEIIAPANDDFNCIGFAMGDNHRWWWPDGEADDASYYWPGNVKNDIEIESFDDLLINHGHAEVTKDEGVEPGYTKLALYDDDEYPTHLAIQLPNGKWASKLGGNGLIIHNDPHVIEGGEYGDVTKIYKLETSQWKGLKNVGEQYAD